MKLEKVIFTDRKSAERAPGQPNWHVVSISGGGQEYPTLSEGWGDVLYLYFEDTDDIENEFAFNDAHAQRVAEFVDQSVTKCDGVLVHCHAGISRSAAVAKWIAERYGLPFDHRYYLYNRLVYQRLVELDATS